ncbi:MAG: YrrS family protein [Bacillus sp. (in: firmicutes)]
MRDNRPSKIGSRKATAGKKRKANMLYNILLGAVIIAIIIVGSIIFLNNDNSEDIAQEETAGEQQETAETTTEEKDDAKDTDEEKETDSAVEETSDDEQVTDEEAQEEGNEEQEADTESETEEESAGNLTEVETDSSEATKAYVNENWKPVGTQQTGEHTANYSKGSTDWKEMEKALAYGAGIDQSNMTVLWLGNGGSPNDAVGTVSDKGSNTKYRVHIQFIDGQGWKPVKLEKLN